MPFLPGSLGQAVASDTPPIMVWQLISAGRGMHGNPLRSHERRFESCRGHYPTTSQYGF